MMRILFVTLLFIGTLIFNPSLTLANGKNQEKNFTIRHTKRPFIKKNDRTYLKNKKDTEQNKVITLKEVDNLIKSGIHKDSMADYKGAMAEFTKALRLAPKNSEVIYYIGLMKSQMEDYYNSLIDFDMAVLVDSESVELYYVRGNVKFELKDYKGAINDYNKALALNPADGTIYYNRALANYYSGSTDSACKDMETALKYNEPDASIFWGEKCR